MTIVVTVRTFTASHAVDGIVRISSVRISRERTDEVIGHRRLLLFREKRV